MDHFFLKKIYWSVQSEFSWHKGTRLGWLLILFLSTKSNIKGNAKTALKASTKVHANAGRRIQEQLEKTELLSSPWVMWVLCECLPAGGPGCLGKVEGQLNEAKSGQKSWKRIRFYYKRTTVVEKINFLAGQRPEPRLHREGLMTVRCVFWEAESKRDPDQTQLPEEGDQCPHAEALRFIQGLWQLLEARVDIFPTCLTSSSVTTGHKNINKSTGGLGDPVFPLKLTRAAAWTWPAMSREPRWPLSFQEHRSRVNQASWAMSVTLKKPKNY